MALRTLLRIATVAVLAQPIALAAQTVVFQPGQHGLSTTQAPADTPYWQIHDFGFLSMIYDEQHDGYRYPAWNDLHDPGYFIADAHNAATGDFNGDGLQDIVITWTVFPHTIENEGDLTVTVLLNDGQGGLVYRPDIWSVEPPKQQYQLYRTHVADFNGDGTDDFVVAPSGVVKRVGPGEFEEIVEPVLLVLSTADGRLEDATRRVQGQEGGQPVAGIGFSHDMSVGDANGDGHPDFMTAKHLFLNDGQGTFSVVHAELPEELRPSHTYVMSSAIGDLNGDGVGDLVVCPSQDGGPGPLAWIAMSVDGDGGFSNRQVVELPDTLFGPYNSRCNDVRVRDVTGDGLADIVFGLTRVDPYYQGRAVRIYVNHGGGVFVDESESRLQDPRKDYFVDGGVGIGEGNLHFADVNGDGLIDIVDSHGAQFGTGGGLLPGITVFLNRGDGRYSLMDREALPWVQRWQLEGFEGLREWQEGPMEQSYPIDLDGSGNIEFLSYVRTPLSAWPQAEPNEMTFYIVRGTDVRFEAMPTSVGETDRSPTTALRLSSYPNPIRARASVAFTPEAAGPVVVEVLDVLGRRVRTLYDGPAQAETIHKASFDATGLPAGVYFIRLEAAGTSSSRAVTVLP